MHGAYRGSVAAFFVFGFAVVIHPGPAVAAPGDGALAGPAAAIAKARAAADEAEQRAVESDGESAAAFANEAVPPSKGRVKDPGSATVGSGTGDQAPQEQAEAGAATDADGEPRSSYDVTAHRDPFRPPRLNAAADARTPLETYQLGQLKLVGVIARPEDGYRAMVEDSSGLGYIITTGTPIGSSGGVVRSIEPRRVVIEESARDFYGDVRPKEVVMELPQEDRSP